MMGDDATRGLIESLQGGGPAGGLCAHWFRADGLVAACQASATEAYMVWHQRGCTATLDTDFPLPPAPLSAAIGAFIRAGHYPDGFLLSPPELRAALRPDCVDFFHSPPDSQLQSMVAANRIYAALLSVDAATGAIRVTVVLARPAPPAPATFTFPFAAGARRAAVETFLRLVSCAAGGSGRTSCT